jgi:hypothetical protein
MVNNNTIYFVIDSLKTEHILVERWRLKKLKIKKNFQYQLKAHKIYACVLGDFCNITESIVNHKYVIISSPEAEAVSGAGLFKKVKNEWQFFLPRFHLGMPAQMDMEVAMWQMANSKGFKDTVFNCNDKNSGIIYFAREGGITSWQKSIFLTTGKSLPTTLVNIHHLPANNKFKRIASITGKINLEGFPQKPETIFLCDPVASGMQQITMIEKLIELKMKPKQVVVIAPMGSFWGLKRIENVCQKLKIKFMAGVCSCLLDNLEPLHYFSPYPLDKNQVADVELWEFMEKYFGDMIHKFCIRGNWTGSFWGGHDFPLECSESELKEVKLSNKALLKRCSELKNKKMDKLVPYSSQIFSG